MLLETGMRRWREKERKGEERGGGRWEWERRSETLESNELWIEGASFWLGPLNGVFGQGEPKETKRQRAGEKLLIEKGT
jgi:hypothetical protein